MGRGARGGGVDAALDELQARGDMVDEVAVREGLERVVDAEDLVLHDHHLCDELLHVPAVAVVHAVHLHHVHALDARRQEGRDGGYGVRDAGLDALVEPLQLPLVGLDGLVVRLHALPELLVGLARGADVVDEVVAEGLDVVERLGDVDGELVELLPEGLNVHAEDVDLHLLELVAGLASGIFPGREAAVEQVHALLHEGTPLAAAVVRLLLALVHGLELGVDVAEFGLDVAPQLIDLASLSRGADRCAHRVLDGADRRRHRSRRCLRGCGWRRVGLMAGPSTAGAHRPWSLLEEVCDIAGAACGHRCWLRLGRAGAACGHRWRRVGDLGCGVLHDVLHCPLAWIRDALHGVLERNEEEVLHLLKCRG